MSRLLQPEADVTARWISRFAIEANPSKLKGNVFNGVQAFDFNVSLGFWEMSQL